MCSDNLISSDEQYPAQLDLLLSKHSVGELAGVGRLKMRPGYEFGWS